jgi:ATP-dependent DNA helicase RecG
VISAAYFRTINDFDAYPDCAGTVFEQIDTALRVVAQATPSRITFFDEESLRPSPDRRGDVDDVVERTRRQETPTYPELAIKEAITNAVVHRDYARVGAEVQLRMYADRLVLMSPGPLPSAVTAESLRQDPHRSERRNPLLAEICFIDYWVERYGTGTTRMIELCRAAGLPDPEFVAEPEGFTVVFRKDRWTPERLAALGLSGRQTAAILALRGETAITTSGYMGVAQVSEATALRDLRDLTRRGVLEVRGAGRSARYVFAGSAGNPSNPS